MGKQQIKLLMPINYHSMRTKMFFKVYQHIHHIKPGTYWSSTERKEKIHIWER